MGEAQRVIPLLREMSRSDKRIADVLRLPFSPEKGVTAPKSRDGGGKVFLSCEFSFANGAVWDSPPPQSFCKQNASSPITSDGGAFKVRKGNKKRFSSMRNIRPAVSQTFVSIQSLKRRTVVSSL